jgi:hypothetical protein
MVGASATGPLRLSIGNDTFGSYTPVLLLSAGVTRAVARCTDGTCETAERGA